MSTVNANDFIKDVHIPTANETAESANDAKLSDQYYIFDSKKATELKRLDEQHHALIELAKGRLVHAPVEQPKRILDIGCGTGITTVTLARMFPEAEVVGVDMFPVPPLHEKPANVMYLQARIEDIVKDLNDSVDEKHAGYTLRRGSFDYVFARYLVLAVSDWPAFISACTALLAPGGWLEVQEGVNFEWYNAASLTTPLNNSPSYPWDWTSTVVSESAKKGYDFHIGKNLHLYMLRNSLNKVTSEYNPLCMYPWPARPETTRMGKYMTAYGPAGLSAFMAMFTSSYSEQQRDEWRRHIEEMFDREKGGEGLHWRFYSVCGRKDATPAEM